MVVIQCLIAGRASLEIRCWSPSAASCCTQAMQACHRALWFPTLQCAQPDNAASRLVAEKERELHRTRSEAVDMLKLSPLDWFGKWQESGSDSPAPAAHDPAYPAKLGKVGVNATKRSNPDYVLLIFLHGAA